MAGTYPDSQIPRARSARQQFWLDHLRAWQAQDTSLRAYAAANGLSSSSLYRAHRRLKRRGLLSESTEAAPAFVPVRVASPAPACRVLLPNDVVVEIPEHTNARCAQPCSNARAGCRLEPRLAAPPPVAAHAAGEGALDPVAATRTLVRAAVEAGARLVEGSEVQGLASTDGRVSGVVLPSGTVEADTVVLAAGTSSKAICAGIGVELPVESSPATLTRFAGPGGLVGRVVAGPDLEIRQDAAGRLFVSDYYVEGESPEDRAAGTLALIRRRFRGADTVTPIDARVGWRPMPADGMPIVGFTPDAPGLYLAVMHAGVVMAPVVGRLATGEIVAGNEAEALAPCRVSRFG